MHIHLVRTGGFAGIRVEREVDSARLTDPEHSDLQRLLENANFPNLPPVMRAAQPGADRFQYDLTVDEDGKTHRVQLDEAAVPETVRPLLQWVLARK